MRRARRSRANPDPARSALLASACSSPAPPAAADEFDKYALESVSASLSSTQAGAHADFTTSFALTEEGRPALRLHPRHLRRPAAGGDRQPAELPALHPRPARQEPAQSECPQDSQVGVSEVTPRRRNQRHPARARLQHGVARRGHRRPLRPLRRALPVVINVRVDPIDYSLVAAVEGAPSAAELISATTTFWGVPAAPIHDELRLTPEEALQLRTPPRRPRIGPAGNPLPLQPDRLHACSARSR